MMRWALGLGLGLHGLCQQSGFTAQYCIYSLLLVLRHHSTGRLHNVGLLLDTDLDTALLTRQCYTFFRDRLLLCFRSAPLSLKFLQILWRAGSSTVLRYQLYRPTHWLNVHNYCISWSSYSLLPRGSPYPQTQQFWGMITPLYRDAPSHARCHGVIGDCNLAPSPN